MNYIANVTGQLTNNQAAYQPVGLRTSDYIRGGPQQEQTELSSLGADLGSDAFYDEVSTVRESIRGFEASLTTLNTKNLYSISAPAGDENQLNALSQGTDELTAGLQIECSTLTRRIAELGTLVGNDEARRGHWETLKGSMGRAVGRWTQIESQHRDRVKEKVARQYRIVKPEATDEEIKMVVSSGAGMQIFDQAVASTQDVQVAQAALSEAQRRTSEIQKIETTLTELAIIFTQIQHLVVTQDHQFTQIEEKAAMAEMGVLGGVDELTAANASAAKRRKRKLIGAAVGLVIMIIIIIIIAVKLGGSGGSAEESKEKTETVTEASQTGTAATAAATANQWWTPHTGPWWTPEPAAP